MSTVKGLAWALGKPCTGVSTLEGMAWNGVAAGGLLCPVMDARRSQVYNALFRVENGAPVRLTEDRPIALSDLLEELKAQEETPVLLGDGFSVAAAAFEAAGREFRTLPPNLRMQNAWGVAMAALGKAPGTADSLLPVYLRLSQAERERNERLAAEAAEK